MEDGFELAIFVRGNEVAKFDFWYNSKKQFKKFAAHKSSQSSMTFEQADQIILEGMGKHFDKALEPYYIKARPKFEEYYKSLD